VATSTPSIEQLDNAAHRKTAQTTTSDIAAFLTETLGRQATAHMCDVDPKTITRWAKGSHTPGEANERRLRTAYHAFQLLLARDSQYTVRSWFLGLNPQLDDSAPLEAIRDDKLREVNVAARAFILGG
jgi:hypothetical protein